MMALRNILDSPTMLSSKMFVDRIYGTIFGNCIGNAVGLATVGMTWNEAKHHGVEFCMNDSLRHFNLDHHDRIHDSNIMLLILQSILENNGQIDSRHLIRKLFSVDINGIGDTTHQVLCHQMSRVDPHKAAVKVWETSGKWSAPNGAVVRTCVLGIHQFYDIEKVIVNTINVCKTTHADPRCIASCVAVTTAIAMLLQGKHQVDHDKRVNVESLVTESFKYAKRCLENEEQVEELRQYMHISDYRRLSSDKYSYTYTCLGYGFWALQQTDFQETLTTIVKEGGDADSNGAVAGALLGCKLGYNAIPPNWVSSFPQQSTLESTIKRFINLPIIVPRSQHTQQAGDYSRAMATVDTSSADDYSSKSRQPLDHRQFELFGEISSYKTALSETTLLRRILGTIYGNCIGDAIGLLTEFMDKQEAKKFYPENQLEYAFKERADKYKEHQRRWEAGDWTDDSDQMILIMQSLVDNDGKVVPMNFAGKLVHWMHNGFPALGDTGGLGIGTTTYQVLSHAKFHMKPNQAAYEVWRSSGGHLAPNGAVMRTSILGIHQFDDIEMVKKNTVKICETTHADPRCVASCVAVTTSIAMMLQGRHLSLIGKYDVERIVNESFHHAKVYLNDKSQIDELYRYMNAKNIKDLKLDEAGKIGYTYKCLGAGFWALRQTDFRQALTAIVKEAGDADTNGAVAGALLGCKLGSKKLPSSWIGKLKYKRWLDDNIDRFLDIKFRPLHAAASGTDKMELGVKTEGAAKPIPENFRATARSSQSYPRSERDVKQPGQMYQKKGDFYSGYS